MKNDVRDVKESETCKNDHKEQYCEKDAKGTVWQKCRSCDRLLVVR